MTEHILYIHFYFFLTMVSLSAGVEGMIPKDMPVAVQTSSQAQSLAATYHRGLYPKATAAPPAKCLHRASTMQEVQQQ